MPIRNLLGKVAQRSSGVLCHWHKGVAPELGDEERDIHRRIFARRKERVNSGLCAPCIPVPQPVGLNGRMEKQEYRKLWVRSLVSKEQSIQAFAAKVETDPNYISSILSNKGKRNVGNKLARRIEREYQLPKGAIDHPSIEAQKIVDQLGDGLSRDDLREIFEFVMFKKTTKN